MRNLKRALSLTLASVMLLGMMVLGTSAASYPDVTDEHNVEAIEVLQAIGVMTGSNSGNFNPDAKVSRIEMAIVMANLLDLDVNYFAGQNNFSDVPEWASGYVNACAANGIVTGVGGGRFGTGNVTATQAALMMLKALGYFQYNSDFGSDWARATANQAAKINLFDDLDVRDNTQLTRNQVAQLALNALESTMVDADDNTLHITTGADAGGIDITGGSVKYVVRSSSNTKVSQAINRDEKNSSAVTGLQGDTVELGEQLFQGDLRKDDAVGTSDDFGRPGVKWTYKSETIGTYANSTSSVFTKRVNANDIYKVIGKSVTDDLKSGRYVLDNYVDGVYSRIAAGDIDNYSHRDNSTKVNGSGNGMVTEVYVNTQDRIVTIVSYNTFVFKAVNDYSESRGTITVTRAGDTDITLLSNNISDADFDLTDIKADDYLLITGVKGSSGRYDPQTLVKAEVVQGAVDSYKVNDSVTIAGNPYSYSLNTKKTGDSGAGSDPVKSTSYTVGQDAAVVLDKYGYIIAVDQAVVSSNYVFISEFAQPSGLSNGKIAASAFFTDGTSKDITVKEAYSYGKDKDGNAITVGMTSSKDTMKKLAGNWYTYSVNSAEEYTLYCAENKYNIGTVAYSGASAPANGYTIAKNNKVNFLTTDGKGAETNSAQSKNANDKTIVLVNDKKNGDVMLYTGVANMPDLVLYTSGRANINLLFNKNSNYAYYVYVEVTGDSSVSNEDSNLLYILSYDGQHRITDNKSYYTYNVLDGVEKTTVESEYNNIVFKSNSNDGDVYRAVHKARTNSDKRITSVEAVVGSASNKLINGTGGTSITEDDGALTLSGGKYTMSNDAVITLILVGKDLDSDGVTAGPRMKDAKKDYEIMTVTAAELANLMKDYVLDYDYQGKVTDTNGTVISELYVTVFEATYNPSNVTKYTVNNSVNVRFSSAKNGTYAAGSSTTKFNEGSKVYVKAVSGWAIDAASTTAVTLKSEGDGVYSFVIADDLAANAIKTVEDKGIKVDLSTNTAVKVSYPAGITVSDLEIENAIISEIEKLNLVVTDIDTTTTVGSWIFKTKRASTGSVSTTYTWTKITGVDKTATVGDQTEFDQAINDGADKIEVTGDVSNAGTSLTGKTITVASGATMTLTGTATGTYNGEGTVKVTGDSSGATINTDIELSGNSAKVAAVAANKTVTVSSGTPTITGTVAASATVNVAEDAQVTLSAPVDLPTITGKGTVVLNGDIAAAKADLDAIVAKVGNDQQDIDVAGKTGPFTVSLANNGVKFKGTGKLQGFDNMTMNDRISSWGSTHGETPTSLSYFYFEVPGLVAGDKVKVQTVWANNDKTNIGGSSSDWTNGEHTITSGDLADGNWGMLLVLPNNAKAIEVTYTPKPVSP